VTAADCVEGVCEGGACLDAECDDGVLNGLETDTDCGGDCDGCGDFEVCVTADDCLSGVCEDNLCAEATCNDGVQNGDETDLDCGGECRGCERGDTCVIDDDCSASVCVDGTCERMMVMQGTAAASNAVIGDYAESHAIIRVDFASPPDIADYDGSDVDLPVSDGSFVTDGISDPLGRAELTVNGVELDDATGHSYYQSISPNYFGVILSFEDGASVVDAYNALVVEHLEGKAVEIVILDESN
jgi:hypothetical protein